MLHPSTIPLVLLAPGNLKALTFLEPLRHERTAPILRDELHPIHLDLLRLLLQLIVCTEHIYVGIDTIRLTRPAELAQSQEPIRSQVMNL